MEHTVNWSTFIDAPGMVIDAARKGTVTIERWGKPFATVRRDSGSGVLLSSVEIQAQRRALGDRIADGEKVRIGRWGTVEAVVEGVTP